MEIRTKSEVERVKKLQKEFPELNNGFSNGLNLREIAQKIKRFKGKNHSFNSFAVETLAKYVQYALKGFEFNGEDYPGLLDEEEYKYKNYVQKVERANNLLNMHSLYHKWSDEERSFVLNLYSQGVSPKEIYGFHLENTQFPSRTYNGLEGVILDARRKGIITNTQRVFWDGDIGFVAMSLVALYGQENNYISKNAQTLDEYFYLGEGRITRSKLSNFYKRNYNEFEEVISDNIT